MGEIKLGTDGYLKANSRLDAVGNGCGGGIVDLWDGLGEDNVGATWRLAGGRFVGVGALQTVEDDAGPELLGDGPLRWTNRGGIEGEDLAGETGGEWGERLAGETCKSSIGTPGMDTVMNVSTSRELTTVSSPVCDRSEKTRETEDVAIVAVTEDPVVVSLRRTPLEDPIEDECGTCLDL